MEKKIFDDIYLWSRKDIISIKYKGKIKGNFEKNKNHVWANHDCCES